MTKRTPRLWPPRPTLDLVAPIDERAPKEQRMNRSTGDTDRPFITVEQAASLLGISRSLAYALAREFLSTHTTGLPCARIGSRRIVIARKRCEVRD